MSKLIYSPTSTLIEGTYDGIKNIDQAANPVYYAVAFTGDGYMYTHGRKFRLFNVINDEVEGLLFQVQNGVAGFYIDGTAIGTGNVIQSVTGDGIITAQTTNGSTTVGHSTFLTQQQASTYGSATQIPIITVNESGHITAIQNSGTIDVSKIRADATTTTGYYHPVGVTDNTLQNPLYHSNLFFDENGGMYAQNFYIGSSALSSLFAPLSHVSVYANGSTYGHVLLSDTLDSTKDVNEHVAATPKAVMAGVSAANQYTRVGNAEANTNMTSTNGNWIDLFGWGTSGQQNQADPGCTNYRPWSNATTGGNGYNSFGYGPSTNMVATNLTGAGNIGDWGVVNSISNGGMRPGLWRTLTMDEWNYLFRTRSANFARFCFAQVNGVNGIILFPDSYTHPSTVAAINTTNNFNGTWGNNPISAAGWTVMEAAGAVFLPAAGYRQSNTVYNDNAYGRYWSATRYDAAYAYSVFFQNTASRTNWVEHLVPNFAILGGNGEGSWDGVDHARWHSRRYLGMSVRLVQDIN